MKNIILPTKSFSTQVKSFFTWFKDSLKKELNNKIKFPRKHIFHEAELTMLKFTFISKSNQHSEYLLRIKNGCAEVVYQGLNTGDFCLIPPSNTYEEFKKELEKFYRKHKSA